MSRVLATLAGLAIAGCAHSATLLDRVKAQGELVVITRNSPATYYETAGGPKGFEYDLAKMFADRLGVSLRVITGKNFAEIVSRLNRGEADLAVGLPITAAGKKLVRYSPPYQQHVAQVVYRISRSRPKSVRDLEGKALEVAAGSSHVETLLALRKKFPGLQWKENPERDRAELMFMVWDETIDYTIADAREIVLTRRYYPELAGALELGEPQRLAWAFTKHSDTSLFDAAVSFLQQAKQTGVLAQLEERYYGHTGNLGYVGMRTFLAHIEQRLPRYRSLFEEAETSHGLDWRLLAAMGYQESQWDPAAVSPTGVRGIMMLTHATAALLGVRNRVDPRESILGGARYLDMIRQKIPERIPEPDRTWLALAAYNVGLGHLQDARLLTKKRGGDPDRWIDVKKNLPLLAQKQWYQQTRNGYARGHEPVLYVENVRNFYDVLQWATAGEAQENSDSEQTAAKESQELSLTERKEGCRNQPASGVPEKTLSAASRTPPPADLPTTPLCG